MVIYCALGPASPPRMQRQACALSAGQAKTMRVASILRDGSCWRGRHNHGFSVGRWVTGGTEDAMLENGASGAVVSALAPICVDKLQRQAEVTTNLIELKKDQFVASSVENGGWATTPERLREKRPSRGPAWRCSAI